MDPVSGITSAASSADLRSVQGHAAVRVLDKALDIQASAAAQLIAALPQPGGAAPAAPAAPTASLGPLGARVDAWA
jgi:Putative motility protein